MTNNDVTNLTGTFAQKSEMIRSIQSSSMTDFDEEAYRPHLDGLDISDEQVFELMRIVWDIMRMWVEMDLPADSCGQIVESIIHPNQDETDSVD